MRAYGQKDPLIEYKKEAFKAFEELNLVIRTETIEKMMRVQLVADGVEQALDKMRPEQVEMDELDYSTPEVSSPLQGGSLNQVSEAPQKRRIVAGPPSRQDDRPMNRSDRRKSKK